MLADYKDIRDTINALRREYHEIEAEETNFYPGDCTASGPYVRDVTRCQCVVEPHWYDNNGTPRYAPHHPDLCPDIYADEVALLRIACQACGKEFLVQMSASESHARVRAAVAAMRLGFPTADVQKAMRAGGDWTLAATVRAEVIHYGDPPRHGFDAQGGLCSGDTMNCIDIAVVEFWERDSRVGWERRPALEVVLPDHGDGPL